MNSNWKNRYQKQKGIYLSNKWTAVDKAGVGDKTLFFKTKKKLKEKL